MDEDEKSSMEMVEDKIFEIMQTTDLSWQEEIKILFNIARICVSYQVLECKCLSERELDAFLDYQKERLLAMLADEKRMIKTKDFGNKKELK
jgi:hypothetical protein